MSIGKLFVALVVSLAVWFTGSMVYAEGDNTTSAAGMVESGVVEAEAITVNQDVYIMGNVGIGTTAPSEVLEIYTNSACGSDNTGKMKFNDGDQEVMVGIDRMGCNAGADLVFETAASDDSVYERMRLTEDGNVGIGTASPSYKLEVAGTCAASSFTNLSSREYKENIKKVDSSKHDEMLTKLMKVNLSTYNYKKEYGDDNSTKLGFIAEEMPKEVLSKDGKGVDVYELLSYTIGAMKAQQGMIKEQQEIVKAQNKKIESLEARISKL